jgi:hypothetical protein
MSVEVNTEILECVFITYHQNKRQSQYTCSSKWYEKIAKFKWLGTTVTNQNKVCLYHMHDKGKDRLNVGIAFHHSAETFYLPKSLVRN